MNCRQFQNRVNAYLDQELNGSTMLEMRRHADACAHCAREIQSTQNLKSMLAGMRSPEFSEARQAAMMEHVMAAKQEIEKDRTWKFALVAALASGVLALGFLETTSRSGPTQPKPTTMASSIDRDQAAMAISDPLTGRPPVMLTSNGQ